jgi:hypothetical protein
MRIRIIAVVAAFSLLITAGIASASSDGAESREDTRFSFGYDPEAQLFFTSVQDIESATLDCSLTGTLTATYEAGEDGAASVIELKRGDAEVGFGPSEEEDIVESATEPVGYAAAIDECGISGIPIGTNGHINHGQFMKAFNEHLDMQGRGCLNRWLAGASLGKDTQQVKHQDFEAVETIGETGTIDFTTVMASCQHGKKDKGEDHPSNVHKKDKTPSEADDDSGHGRPASPGKSDQAPGKSK